MAQCQDPGDILLHVSAMQRGLESFRCRPENSRIAAAAAATAAVAEDSRGIPGNNSRDDQHEVVLGREDGQEEVEEERGNGDEHGEDTPRGCLRVGACNTQPRRAALHAGLRRDRQLGDGDGGAGGGKRHGDDDDEGDD